MADLDYVEIRGRFAVTVGDTDVDLDLDPDTQWCDSGTIRFTPLLTSVHVLAGADSPFKAGNAPIEATIGPDGRLTYDGNPFVKLLDLGSDKVNPSIARNVAAYRVDFLDVQSQGLSVSFASFTFHPLPNVVNDLTLLAPLPTGSGTTIVQGPMGPGGPDRFLVYVNGAYPVRPDNDPVIFLGPDNPDTLGLMLPGDTWVDTDDVVNDAPVYVLQSDLTLTLANYVTQADLSAQKGVADGLATLDSSGKVPSVQLPSYVDDALEFANLAAFPTTGTSGIIYVALDSNKSYRWSGTVYTEISPSEVNSVAGKVGVVTLVPADVGAHPAGGAVTDAMLPTRLHKSTFITDANAAVLNGWYYAFSANSANFPYAGNWNLHVSVSGNGDLWATQVAHEYDVDTSADTKTYRRDRNNGTWSAWYRLRASELEQNRLSPIAWSVASSTTSYWTKVATFTISNIYNDLTVRLSITSRALTAPYTAELTVFLRTHGILSDPTTDYLYVTSKQGMVNSNIRLVKSQTSNGTTPNVWELWIQAPQYTSINTFELARNLAANASVAYHTDSGWTASPSAGTTISDSVDSGWVPITAWTNGWVDYGSGGYGVAAVRKVGNRVTYRGLVKNGSTVAGAGMFGIPAGFAPGNDKYLPVIASNAFGSVFIQATGNVLFQVGSNAWLDLSGITYLVD